MRWSWRVARVADIDIKVHVTFLLILGLGALAWSGVHGLAGAAFGALMMALLFTSVTLHELGHSVVAQRFGVPVREIVLLPIGGVAMMAGRPKKPAHELLIALAGPAVNVVLAIALAFVMLLFYGPAGFGAVGSIDVESMAPSLHTLLAWLLTGNVMLAVFNMVPAFPLDGGRVLRATLALSMPSTRATEIAARVGQVFAIAMGMYGLLVGNLVLMAIAAFIYFGAGRENQGERIRELLERVPSGRVARRPSAWLSPSDPIAYATEVAFYSGQVEVPVVQAGRLVGVVDASRPPPSALAWGPGAYVAQVMDRRIVSIDGRQSLGEVERLMAQGARAVAVYDGDTLMGLLTQQDLARVAQYLDSLERNAAGTSGSFRTRPTP